MNKITILIVTPSLYIGGLENVIANLCRYIDKQKYNISICCIKDLGSIGERLVKEDYAVKVLKKSRFFKNNYFSWLQLLKLSIKLNVDILHSHTLDSLIDSVLCKLINRKIKVVHTFHYGNYSKLRFKYVFIERFFSRFADKLVAVGNEQKFIIEKVLKIGKRKIFTVLNGVPKVEDVQSLPLIYQYRQNERLIIGTVCTLLEQKGLSQLIDVAYEIKRKYRKAIFLVAGEGHLRSSLEEKAREFGLKDDVVFIGWVENPCKTFIPHIDIFFLPSLWEAMSLVVLEAMEAGKPVVVTDVGENRHVIEDGVDGFLATPGKTQSMADIISRLIEEPELRFQTGEKARVKIRTQFSVERMVSAYQALYTNEKIEKGGAW